jgi:transcriptional regulator with XRE-family HTH domain
MTNKEKFLALVSNEKTDTLEKNRERIRNRAMLRESQQVAIKVLVKLDNLGWSQKDLAAKMGISPQQVSKIVSGKENLTIETLIKLQDILNIPILASFYENQKNNFILTLERKTIKISEKNNQISNNYQTLKVLKTEKRTSPRAYYQLHAV